MKKRTSVLVLLLVVLAVGASHIGWIARDNGTLMVLDGREIDVAGIADNQWTQFTRNCNGVVRLNPEDKRYQNTAKLISSYSPPHSASVVNILQSQSQLKQEMKNITEQRQQTNEAYDAHASWLDGLRQEIGRFSHAVPPPVPMTALSITKKEVSASLQKL
jgi:hypothetical protein